MKKTTPKRALAATTGIIAVLAGLIGCVFAGMGTLDFLKHLAHFSWFDLLASLLIWVIALGATWSGIRFLRFAWSGRTSPMKGWLRSIVVGVLFFFPAFVISLPITILWARYTWPGDGQAGIAAGFLSFYFGIAAAVLCCIVLLSRSRREKSSTKSQ